MSFLSSLWKPEGSARPTSPSPQGRPTSPLPFATRASLPKESRLVLASKRAPPRSKSPSPDKSKRKEENRVSALHVFTDLCKLGGVLLDHHRVVELEVESFCVNLSLEEPKLPSLAPVITPVQHAHNRQKSGQWKDQAQNRQAQPPQKAKSPPSSPSKKPPPSSPSKTGKHLSTAPPDIDVGVLFEIWPRHGMLSKMDEEGPEDKSIQQAIDLLASRAKASEELLARDLGSLREGVKEDWQLGNQQLGLCKQSWSKMRGKWKHKNAQLRALARQLTHKTLQIKGAHKRTMRDLTRRLIKERKQNAKEGIPTTFQTSPLPSPPQPTVSSKNPLLTTALPWLSPSASPFSPGTNPPRFALGGSSPLPPVVGTTGLPTVTVARPAPAQRSLFKNDNNYKPETYAEFTREGPPQALVGRFERLLTGWARKKEARQQVLEKRVEPTEEEELSLDPTASSSVATLSTIDRTPHQSSSSSSDSFSSSSSSDTSTTEVSTTSGQGDAQEASPAQISTPILAEDSTSTSTPIPTPDVTSIPQSLSLSPASSPPPPASSSSPSSSLTTTSSPESISTITTPAPNSPSPASPTTKSTPGRKKTSPPPRLSVSRPRSGTREEGTPIHNRLSWEKWGTDEVVEWLKKVGLGTHVDAFRSFGVQGEDLEIIDDEELSEDLEITDPLQRNLIKQKIKELLVRNPPLSTRKAKGRGSQDGESEEPAEIAPRKASDVETPLQTKSVPSNDSSTSLAASSTDFETLPSSPPPTISGIPLPSIDEEKKSLSSVETTTPNPKTKASKKKQTAASTLATPATPATPPTPTPAQATQEGTPKSSSSETPVSKKKPRTPSVEGKEGKKEPPRKGSQTKTSSGGQRRTSQTSGSSESAGRPRGRSIIRKKPKWQDIPWRLWGVNEVSEWLKESGLEQYVETFIDCDCQGEDLELIGDQELADDFEIESASDRQLILDQIQKLIGSTKEAE